MNAKILVVGQGLAGTVLAWEFERAGLPVEIVDAGHRLSASRVGAGIINPVTGRRMVKSWKVDTLLPAARACYRAIEQELQVPLWQELRVRRYFVDDDERQIAERKTASGELAGYVDGIDGDSVWIEQAGRVDAGRLIAVARARWQAAGVLREERADGARQNGDYRLVIDCSGALGDVARQFPFVPWRYSKGECLTVAAAGLTEGVVLNRRHWIVPVGPSRAKLGATHVPAGRDTTLTIEARRELEASAAAMQVPIEAVVAQEAGVRSYLPDKRPVAGRHPLDPRLGVFNGFGAKGSLFAPALARQWVRHLLDGAAFDPEVDVKRWFRPA